MVKKFYGVLMVFMFAAASVAAQDWKSLGVDDIFQLARNKAFNGQRDEAREMLHYILTKSPDYADVRILLGRTYAWDGEREEARKELQTVLEKEPNNQDALQALTDVETWDEKYEQALIIVERGAKHYPNDEDFLYKKANILNNLNRQDEALNTLQQLLSLNPSHVKGTTLMFSIKSARLKYIAGISYNVDFFSRTFDPAHYASAQLARTNSWGSAIVRVNYSHRFKTNGIQPEIDLYPRIVKGVYAYLNYGYATSSLYPDHRIGAEVFTKLPHSMEASGGIRYLYFNASSEVLIYTGSVGWYFKNYWLSVRPYITPDNKSGTSYSATVFLRRYIGNRDNYIGLSAGAGFSPDERRIQSATGLSGDGIYVLKTQRMGLAWSQNIRYDLIVNASLDVSRQELSFDQSKYVLITGLTVGLRKKF